jgi:uncharacterized protein DUF6630
MEDPIKNHADDFRKLALLLSDGDEALSENVVLSEIDPIAYVSAHAEELRRRGINKPKDGLPWIALIDGLENRGKLIELDWKESGEMFVRAARRLLENRNSPKQARDAFSSIKVQESMKVVDILDRIDQILTPYEYSIVMIDIHSDCYPIALTQRLSIPAIMETANRIEKKRIRCFGSSLSEHR